MRALRLSATIEIVSGVTVPIVAMHCATSMRISGGKPPRTADACSGRRWARMSAIVCGISPSSAWMSLVESTASRNSNPLPPMAETTRPMTPAAFSAPKEASSSPVAKSAPPRWSRSPTIVIEWNSLSARSATRLSTRRRRTISAAMSSASVSVNCCMTRAAPSWSMFIRTMATFWVPVIPSFTMLIRAAALPSGCGGTRPCDRGHCRRAP